MDAEGRRGGASFFNRNERSAAEPQPSRNSTQRRKGAKAQRRPGSFNRKERKEHKEKRRLRALGFGRKRLNCRGFGPTGLTICRGGGFLGFRPRLSHDGLSARRRADEHVGGTGGIGNLRFQDLKLEGESAAAALWRDKSGNGEFEPQRDAEGRRVYLTAMSPAGWSGNQAGI